jgi:hypothetical protein
VRLRPRALASGWLRLTPALGLFACGADPPAEAAGATALGIVGGEPSRSGSEDDAVLLLRAVAEGELTCTATLVAKNLVVTTRHCVAYAGPPGFRCTPEGELVGAADGRGTLGVDFPPETVLFHAGELPTSEPVARGARIVSTLSPHSCKNDLAFVVLDRQLDLPIRPIRVGIGTQAGQVVTLVGYGLNETLNRDWRTNPRKRLSGQLVRAVGPDSIQEGLGEARPRTLLLEGPSACQGDSGGPALSEPGGAVIGAFSLLEGGECQRVGVDLQYVHLSPFETLIREAFAAAGAAPWIEGQPDPRLGKADSACERDQDCLSGICTLDRCARRCESDADCPADHECAIDIEPRQCREKAEPPPPPPAAATPGDDSCAISFQRPSATGALLFTLSLIGLVRRTRRPAPSSADEPRSAHG